MQQRETEELRTLRFAVDGERIYHPLGASKIGAFACWDGSLLDTLEGHEDAVSCVVPLRRGEILSAGNDRAVLRWRVAEPKPPPTAAGAAARPSSGRWWPGTRSSCSAATTARTSRSNRR